MSRKLTITIDLDRLVESFRKARPQNDHHEGWIITDYLEDVANSREWGIESQFYNRTKAQYVDKVGLFENVLTDRYGTSVGLAESTDDTATDAASISDHNDNQGIEINPFEYGWKIVR